MIWDNGLAALKKKRRQEFRKNLVFKARLLAHTSMIASVAALFAFAYGNTMLLDLFFRSGMAMALVAVVVLVWAICLS